MAVDKVVGALSSPLPANMGMEDAGFDDPDPQDEPDDDMIIWHFQNEAKLEALAWREPSMSGSRHKKGKKALNS